jgi:hypothetical protein
MDPVVAARLDEFRKNGGKVIAAADKPQMADGSGEYKCDIFEEDFNNVIPLLPQAPYTLEGENVRDVMSVMRESNGEYVILIANQTEGVKKFTFKHDMAKVTEFMEVESGNIYNIPAADNSWVLTLEEGQSLLVRIAETASESVLDRSKFITLPLESEKSVLTLDGAWSFDFGKENIFVPKLSLRYDPCEAGVRMGTDTRSLKPESCVPPPVFRQTAANLIVAVTVHKFGFLIFSERPDAVCILGNIVGQ